MPRGFTLLEVILALGLAVVILGLVGLGINVHLAVATKSREQVEEAQLARILLQRIADDLRNAVPFQPPPSSSSSSGSSGALGQSGSPGDSGSTASSGTSNSSSTTPLSGGIYGTAQAIQIETARRPRAKPAALQTPSDPSQPARLSDIRVVSYSIGAPCTVDLSQQSPPSASGTGLYRHEQDRAEFVYASQNGQVDQSDTAADLLAPEVVDFQITYYGGTAGTASTSDSSSGTSSDASTGGASSSGTSSADSTTNGTTNDDQWDSTQQGMLPAAVRVSISLRRDAPKSVLGLSASPQRPPAVYSLLVSLPNANVESSQAIQQQPMPPQATPFVAVVTTPGGHGVGGRGEGGRGKGEGGRGKGEGGRGKGEGGRGKGGGERTKGGGERGEGGRGRGERGGGQGGQGGGRGGAGAGQGGN